MRLTGALRQYAGTFENLVFKMKKLRRREGFIAEPILSQEDVLFAAKAGIKIEDPNLLWEPKPRFPEWTPPKGFDYQPPIEEHPDYQSTPVCKFNFDYKLLEGLKQALILTKTQSFDGLPDTVTQRLGKVQIPNQDELAQRIILQSSLWDSEKARIKRHRHPETPRIWKFKAEFGVPDEQIVRSMFYHLTRMFNKAGTQHPSMRMRSLTRDHRVSAIFYYEPNRPIQIQADYAMMLSSQEPLSPFAGKDVIDASIQSALPDIFPVSPMIDLRENRLWRNEQNNGWPKDKDTNLHTAFTIHDGFLELDAKMLEQRTVNGLMSCFSMCVTKAKVLYGSDVKVLPQPVCSQHIGMDAFGSIHLTCFQLNTLDVFNENGVKNLVWFENKNPLYQKLIPKRSMLRNTKFVDYDPEVLDKMFTMFSMGVDLHGDERVAPLTVKYIEEENESSS